MEHDDLNFLSSSVDSQSLLGYSDILLRSFIRFSLLCGVGCSGRCRRSHGAAREIRDVGFSDSGASK